MKMPEYITKEQAISVVTASTDYDEEWLVEDIKELPPADVAPVVHGQNISNVHPSDRFKCSQCGLILEDYTECEDEEGNSWVEFTAWNYCPRCGARMEGEEQ